MSEDIKVCVICKKGANPSKRPVNDATMITDLLTCCRERVSLGQSKNQKLTDHLSGFNELELKSVYYHSECRKPIVNKSLIERLRGKWIRPDTPVPCSNRGPVHPSSATWFVRPKRSHTLPKEEVCLFSSCDFCPKAAPEPLHRVVSAMGITLIEVKRLTQDDRVRICVADLEDSGEASGSDSLTPETFNQFFYNRFATLAVIINRFQFQFVEPRQVVSLFLIFTLTQRYSEGGHLFAIHTNLSSDILTRLCLVHLVSQWNV